MKKIEISGQDIKKPCFAGFSIKQVDVNIDGTSQTVYKNAYNLYIKQYNGGVILDTWSVPYLDQVTLNQSSRNVTVSSVDKSYTLPARAGYYFNNWNQNTFNIEEDTTLYGIWTASPSLITIYYTATKHVSSSNFWFTLEVTNIKTSGTLPVIVFEPVIGSDYTSNEVSATSGDMAVVRLSIKYIKDGVSKTKSMLLGHNKSDFSSSTLSSSASISV